MPEKTEPPTARRLGEARAEGQVARSRELNAAAAMLIGAWLLRGPGLRLVSELGNLLKYKISTLSRLELTEGMLREIVINDVIRLVPSLSSIILGLLAAGVIVTIAQTGLLWATKRIGFDFSRLNPMAGLQRMFSSQGLIEFVKALLKLAVVGLVAFSYLRSNSSALLHLGQTGVLRGISQWGEMAYSLVIRIGGIYLVFAIVDYIYQRRRHMKSLRMSKEEVKEEFKRAEGDPLLRGRIRQQQMRIVRQRMMAKVPQADVVITNPTHLAVAVQYDANKMIAPVVLAKGAYRVAERIVSIAAENKIPVVQNIPLARAIYRSVEVEHEIPPDLYLAMAEVLAYVYSLRAEGNSHMEIISRSPVEVETSASTDSLRWPERDA